MIYERQIEERIQPWVKEKEIVVITGMRRVGKTTLLRKIFAVIESGNKVFLDFENLLDRKAFREDDFNNILNNLAAYEISLSSPAYVFIDEIQYQPETVHAIKYLYDHFTIKFFISGSSSFYLKNMFPESLSGRKIIFELFPLTFKEFLVFKGIKRNEHSSFSDKSKQKNRIVNEKLTREFDEYLYFGGFPQVVLKNSEEQKKELLRDIFSSYYQKDIQLLADFRNLRAFEDLVLLLMQRAGSKLDISKLASTVGVSRETVYNYLAFLEGTYFIHLIRPYTTNVDREISGSRKVYVCDTGLVNHFAKVDLGNLFENVVYNNIRQLDEIRYYQRRSGAEIDFILTGQKLGIEVKLSGTQTDLNTLRRTASTLDLKETYIINRNFSEKEGFIPVTEM
jgi:predicted AAA+ superfamily ATPase